MKLLVISAGMILLCNATATAEAWPRGRGALYVHLGGSWTESDESYSAEGESIPFPGRDTREQRLALYVESGLSERTTLVVRLPYKEVRARGIVSTFETRGLADLDVRLRHSRPLASSWLAVEAGAIVPLGYDVDDFPSLGAGETDWIVNGSLGGPLRILPDGFFSIDAGYRLRRGKLADEIPFAVKVGAFPHPRLGTFVFTRGWESRADFSSVDTTFGLGSTDSELVVSGLELYLRASRSFDVNITWSRPIQGRNTSSGDEYAIGIAFHR